MPAFVLCGDRNSAHTRSLSLQDLLKMKVKRPWVGRMPETVHPIPHHILPQSTAKDHRGAVVPQGVRVRTRHRYDVRQRLQSIRVQRCSACCLTGSASSCLPWRDIGWSD